MISNIDNFKTSTTVLDTETTDIDPTKCEIVEIAGSRFTEGRWKVNSTLLGSYGGMPPEASAKNNISNKMINGLRTFGQEYDKISKILNWKNSRYYVAHNANYDILALKTAFSRMNLKDDIAQCDDKSKWICTYRLSKHILSYDETITQFNLGYLRYKLELPISDDLTSHRAKDDTIICANLLDCLIEIAIANGQISPNEDIGLQLNTLCWQHIQTLTWPFGIHKGKKLEDLDNKYYSWALGNMSCFDEKSPDYDYDLAESVIEVLNDRLNEVPF